MLACSKNQFSATGTGRVVLQKNGIADAFSNFRPDIDAPPSLHFNLRSAHFLRPVPQFEWRGDADAGNFLSLGRRKLRFELRYAVDYEWQYPFRQGIGIGSAQLEPDPADKIHQHEIDAAPADLYAKRKDGVRIKPHRRRRLADFAAQSFTTNEKPVLFKRPHDDGDGLCRKAAKS
ncbi:hypothetical protein D3C72_1636400 [compost metagenome]